MLHPHNNSNPPTCNNNNLKNQLIFSTNLFLFDSRNVLCFCNYPKEANYSLKLNLRKNFQAVIASSSLPTTSGNSIKFFSIIFPSTFSHN